MKEIYYLQIVKFYLTNFQKRAILREDMGISIFIDSSSNYLSI
jgi:hypothetical protein